MSESHGVWKPQNSKFYYCSFTVAGNRFNGSTKLASKKEAISFARRWKESEVEKIKKAASNPAGEMTLIDAVTRYMREVGDGYVNSGDYESNFDWLVDNIGPNTLLSEIDDDMLAQLVALRGGERKYGREEEEFVSKTTVNCCVVKRLRALLSRAKTWKVRLPDEPKWTSHLAPERRRVRTMTVAEELAFEKWAADFWPFILFILLTGLRRRDALIRWSQVDYEANVIRVRMKGGKDHEVVITDDIRALLDAAAEDGHPEFVWQCAVLRGEFTGRRVPISYGSSLHQFKRILRLARIENLTLHDLRRTAGERMYRATGDIAAVSKFLGHSSIELTRRYYVHVIPDDVELRMIATAYARQVMRERALARQTVH
ncbi:tyrosine-type recombinase/integrase [Methylobacterium sp. D54C]